MKTLKVMAKNRSQCSQILLNSITNKTILRLLDGFLFIFSNFRLNYKFFKAQKDLGAVFLKSKQPSFLFAPPLNFSFNLCSFQPLNLNICGRRCRNINYRITSSRLLIVEYIVCMR